ncbi:MAG: FtsW/RodA/SpoVE family cell cycle protein [Buchananella hordeovulneris]|nr:FtsW/RodA/SpoVE family cell cycle protein [Buchananella hordeovulneris]
MATVSHIPGQRRYFTEVALLLLSLGLGVAAYVLVVVGTTGTLPSSLALHLSTLVAVGLGTYGLVKWLAPYADPVVLPIAFALNGLGLAMIYRLDVSYLTAERYGEVVGTKQLIITAVGILGALAVLFWVRDHRNLKRFTYLSLLAAVVLLLLPLVPGLGVSNYGARIWINLGVATFQPSELAKVFLAIFFASYLADNRDNLALTGKKLLGLQLPRLRYTIPLLVAWLIGVGILVVQNDYGTSILLFGLFVIMLYVATDRPAWIAIGFAAVAVAGYGAYLLKPHIANRVTGWLHALDQDVYDAAGGSFQLVQGLFGFSTGGLTGTGLGAGHPALVPFANSDFIMASFAEELGLTGVFAILILYGILVERGLRIAIGSRDGFGKLLATGLSFSIALQVFVVVGGLTRVLPLTGLTTPFLASGGSSLLSSWLIIGLLLRMSDSARRPQLAPTVGDAALPTDLDTARPANPPPPAARAGESRAVAPDLAGTAQDGEGPVPDENLTEVVKL